MQLNREAFEKLNQVDKLTVAQHSRNRELMQEVCSMLDPHGRLSDYDDSQWVELMEAAFYMTEDLTVFMNSAKKAKSMTI